MNVLLSVIMLIVTFGSITLVYKHFGKNGLFALIPVMSIVANIQVIKMIEFLGMTCSLGNIVYASSFLITDIISENYGQKDAHKAVRMGIWSFILTAILIQLALMFIPGAADTSQQHLEGVFALLPRIFLGSIVAYAISQWLDVKLFHWFKSKFKALWIRNNGATMTAQAVDSVVANVIMFAGVLSTKDLIFVIITCYIIKFIVAICDTPFLYINKKLFINKKVND